MSTKKKLIIAVLVVGLVWFLWPQGPAEDEAKAKGIPLEFFDQAEDEADYFRDADGGIPLTPAEVRGRNTWWIWTGGNEAFWDYLSNNSFGTFDLLKGLSSYPCSPEQEQRAKAHEARLAAGAAADGTYGDGAYGSSGYAAPPGHRYPGTDEDGETHGQGYACAETMYPAAGQAPYRYYS
ncbi:MAG: hypothetical protein MI919_40185, partial [Holophagales bacterium]|nr:hypothetical protein [Holophagales bacterium]